MIETNKRRSKEKVELAVRIIKQMLQNEEQVVVCELVRRTGLSRSFFYNNSEVKQELDRARELQEKISFVAPRNAVLDKALEKENEILKEKIEKQDRCIADLKNQIEILKKATKKQTLKSLKML